MALFYKTYVHFGMVSKHCVKRKNIDKFDTGLSLITHIWPILTNLCSGNKSVHCGSLLSIKKNSCVRLRGAFKNLKPTSKHLYMIIQLSSWNGAL